MARNDKEKESVKDVVQVQTVQVNIDMSDERILQFNQDEKVELVWSEKSFRELPKVIENQLRLDNFKSYVICQQKVKDAAKKAATSITGFEKPKMTLKDFASYRLQTRNRPGWHSYWAAPGADFDMRMAIGAYKQIRKHKVDASGNDLEPDVEAGMETGEVLKIFDGDGKVELIALECPEEFYQEVINEMSDSSVARYKSQNENFAQTIEEEVNVHVKKEQRVKVYGEGDREIKV